MMDLENVLPTGVQVTSIEPQATPTGDVIIRLRVSGERDRAVQLVRNLEHSRRFLQPRLSGEASQAKETNANAQRPGQFRQPQITFPRDLPASSSTSSPTTIRCLRASRIRSRSTYEAHHCRPGCR